MRGLAAIRDLIDAATAGIALRQPCRVDLVRVRLGSSFSEAALLRGFDLLAVGTALEGADLEIETVSRFVACACGRALLVTADDLIGQRWTCAICGHVEEIDERDDLELLQVIVRPAGAAEVASVGSR